MRFSLVVAVLACSVDAIFAQGPPTVSPQAPNLNSVLPIGMRRGTSVDLALSGTNLADPTGVGVSFPAKINIPTANNNGKDNAKLIVHVEVPADAPLGFHSLRLATRRGISNLRLFCIDDLPEIVGNKTNRARATPQLVPVPSVVSGKCDVAETADWYKIAAKAGQRISFEVLGRRLGSNFDPQLTLYDLKTSREVVGGHSNDAPGLQTDARLTHTFKEAGEYLVELRDVSYRGAGDFHYRLRIGDFPCATTPLPLAIKRGGKANIRFAGPTVDGVASQEIQAPTDPTIEAIDVTPRGANGLAGWPVSLLVSDFDELIEQEPNNEPAKANRVTVPAAITGRFQDKGDLDHFVFAAKKGQRLIIEAQTIDLNSPTEVYMVLRDAKGTQLQASNPAVAPRLDFTAAADGDYNLAVEHLHYWGGPDETYRITFVPYEPGFSLAVALDRFQALQGGSTAIPVLVTRHDYAGPIEISVHGDGVSGLLTVPAGLPPQPNQPGGQLLVTVPVEARVGPHRFAIVGKANIQGKPFSTHASVRGVVTAGLASLPVPPRQLWNQLALAVTEKAPYSLTASFERVPVYPGETIPLTVVSRRDAGFAGEITLSVIGLPANVKPELKPIAANTNEFKGQLQAAANAAVGPVAVTFVGKAKHNGLDFEVKAPPIQLIVAEKPPFSLSAKFDMPAIMIGKSGTVVVTANRATGFGGDIALSITGLPANVMPVPQAIAAGNKEGKVLLNVANNAAPGQYPVTISGKSKHMNKDYSISTPPLMLMLTK